MDALDSKTGIIAGFDGLIITAAVGLMPDLLTKQALGGSWPYWVYRVPVVVLACGLIAVVTSFMLAIRAYRVRTYNEVINPSEAYNRWLSRSESQTRLQLLHNMIEASEHNEAALDDKAESIKKSIWWLLAGVLTFFLAAMLLVVFSF